MSKKPNAEIGVDQWLAELERVDALGQADGLTLSELLELRGLPSEEAYIRRKALAEMKRLIRAGRAVCAGRKRATDVSGRTVSVPAYRLAVDTRG